MPVFLLVILLGSAISAFAAVDATSVPEFTSADCEKCHVGPEVSPDQRTADYPKTLHHIDWKAFRASVHARGGLTCTDCHAGGYATFPHAKGKLLTCFDCHPATEGEFQAIRASQARSVHSDILACRDCHDPHTMRRAQEQTIAEKDRSCVECHQDPGRTGGRTMVQLHSWHPQAALHLEHLPCIACHTQPEAGNRGFSHRIRPKGEASRDCLDCHAPDGKMVHYLTRLGHAPEEKTGPEMVRRFYLSGETRARGLDLAGLGLLLLVATGIAFHAALRVVRRRRR
jgi:predicted CXXCH cytochrome family protein